MYTGDPANNPLDRVRIFCTDTDNDNLIIEDSILEFFLDQADGNEKQAAVKALGYILFQLAKMPDEKVGGVYLKNSEITKNLQLVLDDLKEDLIGVGVAAAYAGGISKFDVWNRRSNPDSISKPTNTGDAFSINRRNGYYDEDDNLFYVDELLLTGIEAKE